MADKILVCNKSALGKIYGTDGTSKIKEAIQRLIAADKDRGLATEYIWLDDADVMKTIGGRAVSNSTNQQQNKDAVDAIYDHFAPDYLVIVGGPGVIPHLDLQNPVYSPPEDPDNPVPSDLPYACHAPLSTDPGDFVGPTRVVSRIPDLTGTSDVQYFVDVIDHAAGATSKSAAAYSNYLGVTAKVWTSSTKSSLNAIFTNHAAIQEVPPSDYKWTLQLNALSHFFNCHGSPQTSQFFGQTGQKYPVAHDAAYIMGKIIPGTVTAAECCYGAELYNPRKRGGPMSISNSYMLQGAYGFFGSTTIAYGPASGNDNADLICQYFMQEVLHGNSIGQAALRARQRYAQHSSAMSPTDLKTLSQFVLLGDASIHCVAPPASPQKIMSKAAFMATSFSQLESVARKDRRVVDAEVGLNLSRSKRVAVIKSGRVGKAAQSQLEEIAARANIRQPKMFSYELRGGSQVERKAKTVVGVAPTSRFHIMIGSDGEAPRGLSTRLLEVQEAEGKMTSIRELYGH